jgi:GNAT superfamily N-acetyltransferase
MDIKIRPAASADAPVIADFNRRLAKETEGLKLDPARVQAGVNTLLREPTRGIYYVAEVEGAIAGQLMITYEWSDWRNGNIWWIQSVYVAEKSRGGGVFKALFNHVRALAEKEGNVPNLRLYVEAHNTRARQAYGKLGFKKTYYEIFELEVTNPLS